MPTGYRKAADLPQVIPVFPLDGALLLPGGQLPLNIFEPRYLNMLDDAMGGERIIGMIQTRHGGDPERPRLAAIGCLGKVTSFAETADGRYLITLTGICRFVAGEELPARTPYRQVRADYAPFEHDLTSMDVGLELDRGPFLAALKHYLERRGMEIDWESAESAPCDALVNSLSMALPFDAQEKQALLEARTAEDRRTALIAMLEIDAAAGPDDEPTAIQ
ncbi:LON peptidase substrate-binding domain-containing protein [Caulobacter sp. 73W]|uniref:LON peptidase substrate-binding domain-containing protein n=1 Tax=Caulobacter sp. 73W TaxID=3161137 RepID=A0AB39KNW0_9CAUL